MNINKDTTCKTCLGSGGIEISFDPVYTAVMCPDCKGTGKINTSVLFTK